MWECDFVLHVWEWNSKGVALLIFMKDVFRMDSQNTIIIVTVVVQVFTLVCALGHMIMVQVVARRTRLAAYFPI